GTGVALDWRRIGPAARSLAVATPHVVIGGDDSVVRVTLDGSAETVARIANRGARAVAARDDVAAWAERDTHAVVVRAGGETRVLHRDHHPWSLYLEGEDLFWATPRLLHGNTMNACGSVRRAAIGGGPVETLADGVYQPDHLCCRDGAVWHAAGPAIDRIDLATRRSERVVAQRQEVGGLACVRDVLIWVDGGTVETLRWRVRPRPIGGPPVPPTVRPLATAEDAVVTLCGTTNGVVWLESPGGYEPCTLHACTIDTLEAFAIALPAGTEPTELACDATHLAIASAEATFLAPLPPALVRDTSDGDVHDALATACRGDLLSPLQAALVGAACAGAVVTSRGTRTWYVQIETVGLADTDVDEAIWSTGADRVMRGIDGRPLVDLDDEDAAFAADVAPFDRLLDPGALARLAERYAACADFDRRQAFAALLRRVVAPLSP
ncbi:MAG: hypothetical protein IT379_36060, partial [Deltaproteobacteria bacterium]|nr:hypothetical protein [Deltaproteobacteria bacterium]